VQQSAVRDEISEKDASIKSGPSNLKLFSTNFTNSPGVKSSNSVKIISIQPQNKRRQRKFKRRRRRKNVLVSTLDIFDVRQTDGGVYTCTPSNAKNHSVIVHVVKGNLNIFVRSTAESFFKC